MICLNCGSKLNSQKITDYHYTECGLKNIFLKNITVDACIGCDEEYTSIPNVEGLHELIANIVVSKKSHLKPEEFRFLRTYLGYSSRDFSELVKLAYRNYTQLEKGKYKPAKQLELFVRSLVYLKHPRKLKYDTLLKNVGTERKTPKFYIKPDSLKFDAYIDSKKIKFDLAA